MVTLLEITSLILICLCIVEAIQIRCISSELDDLIKGFRHLEADQTAIKAKLKLFEHRFQKLAEPADKLIIEHEYSAKDAPKYGEF